MDIRTFKGAEDLGGKPPSEFLRREHTTLGDDAGDQFRGCDIEGGIIDAHSCRGDKMAAMSESTCSAEINPSPVVLWSKKMKWPDCSPPKV